MGEDAEQVDEARRGSRASRPQLQALTSDAIRGGEADLKRVIQKACGMWRFGRAVGGG